METFKKTALLQDDAEGIFQKDIASEHFQFSFTTGAAPAEAPERNDYYWPKIYDLKNHHFEIAVTPVNTPYWRFGFRYSKTGKFPSANEVRHADKEIADIHICVGDMGENRKWVHGNKVSLQSYHVKDKFNHPSVIENRYKGEEIIMTASWNEKTSAVHYELKSNGKIIYQNAFELKDFNYCIFGAWSDFNEFALAADIKVINR